MQDQTATNNDVNESMNNNFVKSMNKKNTNIYMIMASVVIVLLGVATGWVLTGNKTETNEAGMVNVEDGAKEAGAKDASAFKDSVEGILKVGGIGGEGTHHLERDGGPTQYVYLTSTVIDLDSFNDKKVTVWGQTMSARKAGWLMDVGRIKVSE